MHSKNLRLLWLVLAALPMFFSGGRWNIPLAAWITPIFAIRFFHTSDKAGRSFLLFWLVTTIPGLIAWYGATFFSFIHPAVEITFLFLTAPLGLVPYLVDRLYYHRFGSRFWLTLVYPIAATAMDFLGTGGSPFGTFGAMGYSQRGFLPVMQIASLTGVWGITFLLSWCASLVNYVWEHGFKLDRPALTSAGLLALVLAFGFGRSLLAPAPGQVVPVAGFSLPAGELAQLSERSQAGDEAGYRQAVDELHTQELDQIRKLAQQGARIVVLQEGAGQGDPAQVEKLLADASALAKETGTYIVLPTFVHGNGKPQNMVQIIDPHGEVVLEHLKYGGTEFEGSQKGSGKLQTVDTPYGRLSAIICWDADFPAVVRQAGKQNVDLLFVPSNDWLAVKDIHAGMASFRAVENGLSIFRQTGSGVSSVTDAYGRTLQHVDSFEEKSSGDFTAVHMVNVPIRSARTLYPLIGDRVGTAMLVGLAGLCVGLFLSRKRRTNAA